MSETKQVSKKVITGGWIITIICILFLLLDSLMKVFKATPSMEASVKLGLPAELVQGTGILLLVCTVIYIIPRTAIAGALLLTAYLGGATAIMFRAQEPLWFPVAFGVLIWAGIYLRNAKFKEFMKMR